MTYNLTETEEASSLTEGGAFSLEKTVEPIWKSVSKVGPENVGFIKIWNHIFLICDCSQDHGFSVGNAPNTYF